MKYGISFLVSLFLLAACETTNVYPTEVVEKPVASEPVTIEKIVTKIDCASIDPSFEQVGDTCVSKCVACLKDGGECIDTNKNGYGDTCVTPVETPPAREPPADLCAKWKSIGTPCFIQTPCQGEAPGTVQCDPKTGNQFCSVPSKPEVIHKSGDPCDTGFPGVCAKGYWQCKNSGWTVCLQVTPASVEVCDGADNDCDYLTDNDCAPKVDSSKEDKDNDGIEAKVDCDDNDPLIGIEFAGCVEYYKQGVHQVVFVDKQWIGVGLAMEYKEVLKQADLKVTDYWTSASFKYPNGTLAIPLQGGCMLHFNVHDTKPDGTLGYMFDTKKCSFNVPFMPLIYEFHGGMVTKKTDSVFVDNNMPNNMCVIGIPLFGKCS